MKVFNRIISLEQFEQYFYDKDITIITAVSKDKRSSEIVTKLSHESYIEIDYSINKCDLEIIDKFEVRYIRNNTVEIKKHTSLFNELDQFVEFLNKNFKNLLIDISGLHIRFLGALLAKLKDYTWEGLYCSYTEPLQYNKKNDDDIFSINNFNEYTGQFDLYNGFVGVDDIPNLTPTVNENLPCKWIVFLGFEGGRPQALRNEICTPDHIIPVVTVPAMNPGWNNYAFDSNRYFFELSDITCTDIDYLSAINPFSTYNYLVEKQCDKPEYRLIVSPLSTRATSLGVLLYTVNHPECEIVYDNPKEDKSNSSNCGKIHIFDILAVLQVNDL